MDLEVSTNVFQQEVGSMLSKYFSVSERLDDAAANRYGEYQVSKKPYDFFGCTKHGVFWCAESKMIKSTRFPIRNMTIHQRDAMANVEDSNGFSFVFINWRTIKAGEAIMIDFNEYCDIEYKLLNRKSLTPNHFDEDWFLKRETGGWSIPKNHILYNII